MFPFRCVSLGMRAVAVTVQAVAPVLMVGRVLACCPWDVLRCHDVSYRPKTPSTLLLLLLHPAPPAPAAPGSPVKRLATRATGRPQPNERQ